MSMSKKKKREREKEKHCPLKSNCCGKIFAESEGKKRGLNGVRGCLDR
jgi:hypothetical protein